LMSFSAICQEVSETRRIVNLMLQAIEEHRGSTYNIRTYERLVNQKELFQSSSFNKINVQPRKIYLKMTGEQNKGTEILYVEGARDNKALVNAGKFLPSLRLSIFGSLMTRNQHHTILSS